MAFVDIIGYPANISFHGDAHCWNSARGTKWVWLQTSGTFRIVLKWISEGLGNLLKNSHRHKILQPAKSNA